MKRATSDSSEDMVRVGGTEVMPDEVRAAGAANTDTALHSSAIPTPVVLSLAEVLLGRVRCPNPILGVPSFSAEEIFEDVLTGGFNSSPLPPPAAEVAWAGLVCATLVSNEFNFFSSRWALSLSASCCF